MTARIGTVHVELDQADPRNSTIVLDLRGVTALELSLPEARAVVEAISSAGEVIDNLDAARRALEEGRT